MKTIIPSRKATKQYLGESPTMKMDADEKELLDSVERANGSRPRVPSASAPVIPATGRRRSARTGG